MRRNVGTVAAAAVVALAAVAEGTCAQEYPAKPIRFLIPYPPGGGTDLITRVLAGKIGEQSRWTFILENKPGVGGAIGVEQAARSAPDGYTLVMGQTSNLALNPTISPRLAYDPLKDLIPVSMVASGPLALVGSTGGRIASLMGLIAEAKAKPGSVMFGSPGNATLGHLGGELFSRAAGVKLEHIPYRGAAQALTDVLGGRLDLYVSTIPAALGQIKAGKLRGIAVMGLERHPDLPDVPTVAEAIAPGFEVANWYGVLVPAGTPVTIVARLGAEIGKALSSKDVREKYAAEGVYAKASTPGVMAAHIKAEIEKWAPVIRESGVKLE